MDNRSRDRLRQQVRTRLEDGRLPAPGAEMWVGRGCGASCAICDRVIHYYSHVEYEIPNGDGWLHAHLPCFMLWSAEAQALADHHTQLGTLGGLLFGTNRNPYASEQEWAALVRGVAHEDFLAFHALYRRIHGVVFKFLLNGTGNREVAERLTVDVFHDVWRQASLDSLGSASVVGWIMNLARSRALEQLRFQDREQANAALDAVPPVYLWERLAQHIGGALQQNMFAGPPSATEPDWEDAAPGISYKILARDMRRERVSLLVRLAPGVAYPPHTHAGLEELYLLDGELWIDSEKVGPGEYHRADAGSSDQRVWSETGCSCVLLTSTADILR